MQRLCEDAVAVTSTVHDEPRERYAFAPGQLLTLRRRTAAGEERRARRRARRRPPRPGDLPFACTGGVGGTCRARVTAGAVSMRRNHPLEPDEVAAGYVLTCQSTPRTDRVTVDYDG